MPLPELLKMVATRVRFAQPAAPARL